MEDLQYVGFWARFWASVVDVILFMMIIYPLFYMMYGADFIERAADLSLANTFIGYLFPFIAILVLWHYKSATPGKMFIKAKIVDATTLDKPTTKQFIIRNLGYYVSILPLGLGYFWAGWDKRKQTWHDKIAHTVVVQPKTIAKKRGIGSYIAIVFGVFAMGVFVILVVLGIRLQSGIMPDGNLYDAKKLPSSVSVELLKKNVFKSAEALEYYQPQSLLSFTDSGTVFTKKTIYYFETDDEGEVLLWQFPLKYIDKLVFESQSYVLGIELVTMTLYTKNGEVDLSMVLSPKIENAEVFKKRMMDLWTNARK